MGGGFNWLGQVFQALDQVGGALSQLDSLQEEVYNREPFTDMCGD